MRWLGTLPVVVALACLTVSHGPASGAEAPREIPVTIEKNRFQPDEIKVKADTPFILVVTNNDKGPEEFDILTPRIEKVIPAGKTVKIRFPALKRGAYPFVGEYHNETAKGKIIAE